MLPQEQFSIYQGTEKPRITITTSMYSVLGKLRHSVLSSCCGHAHIEISPFVLCFLFFFTCITSPSEPTKATMPWSAAKQSIVGVPWKQSIRYVKRQTILGFGSYETYYILEKPWSKWYYTCRVNITCITEPKMAANLNTVIGWSYSIRGGFFLFYIFKTTELFES